MSNRPFQNQPGNAALDGIVFAQTTSAPISRKANLTAVADPTVNDDSGDGYGIGSIWINTADGSVFLCGDATVGAAIWKEVGVTSGTPDDHSVTPVKISTDFGGFFRNKLKNPDFNVSSNGTSFSTPASGSETLDKWVVTYDGTIGAFTASQQSFTVGQTDVPDEPEFFFRWNQTSAGSGSSFRRIEQRITNVRTLALKTATVTFYAKADSSRSVTGSLVQNFGSGGSADVATSLGTFSVTSSWQKFTASVSIPSISGKVVGSGNYLALRLALPINSTMTIDIAHAQVEENGGTAFEQRPITLEQFLCIGLIGTVTSVDASGGVETASGSAITSTGTIRGSHTVNAQTGTTYTYLTGDRGKLVTHSNGSSIAGTLPQAGASFPSGWFVDVQNTGVGTLTITPTTSTIDGASSLVLRTNQGVRIFSDGTNYFTLRGGAAFSIPILTKSFTSTAQTLTTSSTLTLAHGLGEKPKFVTGYAKCISNDANFTVGMEKLIDMAPGGASSPYGVTIDRDAADLIITTQNGSFIGFYDPSTFAITTITLNKWEFYFQAYA